MRAMEYSDRAALAAGWSWSIYMVSLSDGSLLICTCSPISHSFVCGFESSSGKIWYQVEP